MWRAVRSQALRPRVRADPCRCWGWVFMSTEMDHEPGAEEATRQHMDEWQRGETSHVGEEDEGAVGVGRPVWPPAFRDAADRSGSDIFLPYSYEEVLGLWQAGVAEGRRQAAAQQIAASLDPHQVLIDVMEIAPDGTHTYWSTHCRHGRHDLCSATEIHGEIAGTGMSTALVRNPATCKTCLAPCICPCGHEKGSTDG
jgi:hypothetical protein